MFKIDNLIGGIEMETMSVQRGLMELKTLGNRITRATQQPFVSFYVGDKGAPQGFKTPDEFSSYAQGRFDSATDLIKRRNAIKAAIIQSNAVTKVTVAGKSMTVAEAIDRKDSIVHEKVLLQQLQSQFSEITRRVAAQQQVLDARIDKVLEEEGGKDRKVDDADHARIVKNAESRYKPNLVDPIGIRKVIEQMEEDISSFELDVDASLSEINARTDIEFEVK